MPAVPPRLARVEDFLRPRICRSNVDIIGVCAAFFFSTFGLDREQITPVLSIIIEPLASLLLKQNKNLLLGKTGGN